MANLRLGWLYSQPYIIDPINRIRPPFNTAGIAQAAGIVALQDMDWVKNCVQKNAKVKSWFVSQLTDLGINFIPYTSNFVMAHFKNADQVYQYLGQKGLVVRPMKAYDLPEYLRITIGIQEQMEELVSVLRACPLI
jgi:histidinol-phosphate aminotransferase